MESLQRQVAQLNTDNLAHVSGWTHETLMAFLKCEIDCVSQASKARFDTHASTIRERFEALEKHFDFAMQSQDKAVLKAENATNERFHSMNEFRAAMAEQAADYIPRKEAEQRMKALDEKLALIAGTVQKTEGRTDGVNAMWIVISTCILIGLNVIGLVLRFK